MQFITVFILLITIISTKNFGNITEALFLYNTTSNPYEDRELWINTLIKIADPVLQNLSNGTFKKKFPSDSINKNRITYSYLECFGRLVDGLAPWLELGPDNTKEGKLRANYIYLVVKSIENAVNPDSPDYLNFGKGAQCLVDTAYLSQGLLRAPKQLWGNLSPEGKNRLILEIKRSRNINPPENNWLLFATIVEAALLEFTGEYDTNRLNKGIKLFRDKWYIGDGTYSDGNYFHMDYYNSYVIHPMLIDSLFIMKKHNIDGAEFLEIEMKRFTRYAQQQERLISPEGTYPVIGRTITCRFGAFQVLSQAALLHLLPKNVLPAQVRCALSAVIRNQFFIPGTFDQNDYLRIGFAGYQKKMGEKYISSGSSYHCSLGFLALGLSADDEFWSAPFAPWSNLKAWNGIDIGCDRAID